MGLAEGVCEGESVVVDGDGVVGERVGCVFVLLEQAERFMAIANKATTVILLVRRRANEKKRGRGFITIPFFTRRLFLSIGRGWKRELKVTKV